MQRHYPCTDTELWRVITYHYLFIMKQIYIRPQLHADGQYNFSFTSCFYCSFFFSFFIFPLNAFLCCVSISCFEAIKSIVLLFLIWGYKIYFSLFLVLLRYILSWSLRDKQGIEYWFNWVALLTSYELKRKGSRSPFPLSLILSCPLKP